MKKAIGTIALTLALLSGCSAPDTSSHVSEGSSVGVAATTSASVGATVGTEAVETTVAPTTTIDSEVQYGIDFLTGFIAQAPPDVIDAVCNMQDTLGTDGAVDYLADNVDFATTYKELQGWAVVLDKVCD